MFKSNIEYYKYEKCMTIKDTIKQLFKCSKKNTVLFDKTSVLKDLKRDFSLEEFEKKYTKGTEKSIKNISSMNNKQKNEELETVSEGVQYMDESNLQVIFKGQKNLSVKFNIVLQCMKKYQGELRKSLQNSNKS